MFQIGSVTKVFTALALADAVVSGDVTLDTTVATLLPGTPTSRWKAQITLGQLASHTSGLPRLPPGLRRQALRSPDDPYRNFSTSHLLGALEASRPRPAPGGRVRYSNFGMALLGEALSRRSNLPYGELIADRVAGPLGLVDTGIALVADQEHRAATSHSRRGRPVPDWDLGGMPGAGALRSTVRDLLTLLRAHLDPGSTPIPEALALVQQPRAKANRWLQIGLAWHLSPLRGTGATIVWHNGATAGSHSFLALLPAARAGVVVLSNTGRPVEALGHRVLQRLAALQGS